MKITKSIYSQRKTIINDEVKKEKKIICLYSNWINNDKNSKFPLKSVYKFVLGEKLGEGIFGEVRMAINKQTGEKVDIKILKKSKLTNYNNKNILEREINILNKIHHPIIFNFCF